MSNQKVDINQSFRLCFWGQKPMKAWLSPTKIPLMTIVGLTKATKWNNMFLPLGDSLSAKTKQVEQVQLVRRNVVW